MDDRTDNSIRRSQRVKIKPIEYWNNERIHRKVFSNEVFHIEANDESKMCDFLMQPSFPNKLKHKSHRPHNSRPYIMQRKCTDISCRTFQPSKIRIDKKKKFIKKMIGVNKRNTVETKIKTLIDVTKETLIENNKISDHLKYNKVNDSKLEIINSDTIKVNKIISPIKETSALEDIITGDMICKTFHSSKINMDKKKKLKFMKKMIGVNKRDTDETKINSLIDVTKETLIENNKVSDHLKYNKVNDPKLEIVICDTIKVNKILSTIKETSALEDNITGVVELFSISDLDEFTNDFQQQYYISRSYINGVLQISIVFLFIKSEWLHLGVISQSTVSKFSSLPFSTASVDVAAENLENILRNKFPNATTVQVKDVSGGCGSMYEVWVATQDFINLSIVKQHKLITQALKEEIKDMHGLRITTTLPES